MTEIAALKKQAKKYLDTADEKVVKMVYAMLEVDANNDWWNELSNAEKNSIKKGLKDADDGKVTLHSTAMKKYKKWLL